MALTRDRIRLFAIDGQVVVVPEDVWLRGCGTWWTESIAQVLGLGDNAAHWAARFWCKCHSRNVLERPPICRRVVVVVVAVVVRVLPSHVSAPPMTTISSTFEPFREHLDEHYDRRDRLIKVLYIVGFHLNAPSLMHHGPCSLNSRSIEIYQRRLRRSSSCFKGY